MPKSLDDIAKVLQDAAYVSSGSASSPSRRPRCSARSSSKTLQERGRRRPHGRRGQPQARRGTAPQHPASGIAAAVGCARRAGRLRRHLAARRPHRHRRRHRRAARRAWPPARPRRRRPTRSSWRGRAGSPIVAGWRHRTARRRSSARPMAARPLRRCGAERDWPPIEWWTGPVDVVLGAELRRAARPGGGPGRHRSTTSPPWRFPELCTRRHARSTPASSRRAVPGGAHVHHPVRRPSPTRCRRALGVDRGRGSCPVHIGVDARRRRRRRGRAGALAGGDRYVLAARHRRAPQGPALAGAARSTPSPATDPDAPPGRRRRRRLGRRARSTPPSPPPATATASCASAGSTTQPRADLLAGASVFAYPSVYEGFGLPAARGDGRRRPGGGHRRRRAARGASATPPSSSRRATSTPSPPRSTCGRRPPTTLAPGDLGRPRAARAAPAPLLVGRRRRRRGRRRSSRDRPAATIRSATVTRLDEGAGHRGRRASSAATWSTTSRPRVTRSSPSTAPHGADAVDITDAPPSATALADVAARGRVPPRRLERRRRLVGRTREARSGPTPRARSTCCEAAPRGRRRPGAGGVERRRLRHVVTETSCRSPRTTPLRPVSPYAAQQGRGRLPRAPGLPRPRPRRHAGPGRSTTSARARPTASSPPALAARIAAQRARRRRRGPGRQPRRPPRLHRRARRRAGLPPARRAGRAGRGLQRLQRAATSPIAASSPTGCSAWPSARCASWSTPTLQRPVDVAGAARRRRPAAPGHRLGARDPPRRTRSPTCSTTGADRVGQLSTSARRRGREPTIDRDDQARAHHRHHRPGRLLPRRAPARQGLRGHRHGAAQLSTVNFERIAHIQDRITLRPRRPARRGLADRRCSREHRPARGLQPRRPVASCRPSFGQPVLTGEFTALGVTRILDAIRIVDPDDPLLPGVARREMFGKVHEVPQTETHAVLPPLPLRRGQGLRPLDHGQLPRELRPARQLAASSSTTRAPAAASSSSTRKISHAVAQIKLGLADELRLGNLDAQRDWGFAGDYVEAMWLMLQQDEPDDYVVATGETHSVREFCELAFGHVGLDWEKHVVIDERFFRPAEVDLLVGDPTKARDGARLEAQDELRGAGAHDGRRRPRAARRASCARCAEPSTVITVLAGGVGAARVPRRAGPGRRPAERSPPSSTSATTSSCTACTSAPTSTPSPTRSPARSTPRPGWGLAGETWQAMDDARPLRRRRLVPPRRPRPRHPPVPHRSASARARRCRRSPPRSPRRGASGCALLPVTDDRLRTDGRRSRERRARSTSRTYFVRPPPRRAGHAPCASTAPTRPGPAPGVLDAIADGRRRRHRPVEPDRVDRPGARRARRARRRRGARATASWPSRPSSPAPRSRARPTGCSSSSATRRRWSASPASTRRCVGTLVDRRRRRRRSADGRRGRGHALRRAPTRSCATPERRPPRSPRAVARGGRPMSRLEIFPIDGVPEVRPGDDLAGLIADAAAAGDGTALARRRRRRRHPEDRVEGRGQARARSTPTTRWPQGRSSSASRCAILRRRGDLIISETKHGFVCANAGIDLSNVEDGLGRAAARRPRPLGPPHPRRHPGPRRRRGGGHRVRHLRPARGAAASPTSPSAAPASPRSLDLRGTDDALGRELQVTEVAVVDELAGAADLVMGKATRRRRRRRPRRRPGLVPPRRGAGRDRPPPRRGPLPLASG